MYDCPEASPGYKGTLKVRMVQANDLPNTDEGWWNYPDPYAVVVAVDKTNYRHEKSTVFKRGTTNPYWNQELDFGHSSGGWRYFTITIYDIDNHGADKMIGTQTIWVYPSCSTHTRRFCYSLTRCVEYNFRLEDVNVDNCNSNPCIRGACRDRFCDYSCSCPRNYSGKRCEWYNPPVQETRMEEPHIAGSHKEEVPIFGNQPPYQPLSPVNPFREESNPIEQTKQHREDNPLLG